MNKKVLIVDDDNLLLDNLSATFTKEGFVVETAENGAIALEIIKKEKPDFILLDLVMPVMGGMALIKDVEILFPDLLHKMIVMTNSSDMDHMAEVLASGVGVYVNKSNTDLDKILEMVKERLK